MITKEQAMIEDHFIDYWGNRWRRNGVTKTWKTRPEEFRLPIKCGFRQCYAMTHENAHRFFVDGRE